MRASRPLCAYRQCLRASQGNQLALLYLFCQGHPSYSGSVWSNGTFNQSSRSRSSLSKTCRLSIWCQCKAKRERKAKEVMKAFIDPVLHEEGWLLSKHTPAERFLWNVFDWQVTLIECIVAKLHHPHMSYHRLTAGLAGFGDSNMCMFNSWEVSWFWVLILLIPVLFCRLHPDVACFTFHFQSLSFFLGTPVFC